MIRSVSLSVLPLLAVVLMAGDAVTIFQQAMAGDSLDAKRAAIQGLGSVDEDTALRMLIGAVDDRQARDAAIAALRARTGLVPATEKGAGGYPGYPRSDSASNWSIWLTERTKAKDEEKKLKEIEKKLKEAKDKDKKKPTDEAKPDTAKPKDPAEPPPPPPDDLGRPARISFTAGGNLVCYIRSERKDAEGKLVSLRVVHLDNGGEEVLDAKLISRIDRDIR